MFPTEELANWFGIFEGLYFLGVYLLWDQSRRPDEDSGPFVARILAVLRPDAVDRGVAAAAQGVQVLLGAYTVNMVVMACWSIVVHPAQLPVEVAYYLAAGIPVMFVGYAYLVSKAVGGFVARLVRWNNT